MSDDKVAAESCACVALVAAGHASQIGGTRAAAWRLAGKKPLRERWVYIFRQDAAGPLTDPAELWAEVRTDEEGLLWPRFTMSGEIDVSKPRKERGPDPLAGGYPAKFRATFSLPREAMGVALRYFLFGSKVRLPKKQLDLLMDKAGRYLPAYRPPGGATSTVPVLDPLLLADDLNDAMRTDLDLGLALEKHAKGKHALATTVLALAEADKSGKLHVREHLDLDALRRDADAKQVFGEKLYKHLESAQAAAAKLCNVLDSDLLEEVVEPAYREHDRGDFPEFIKQFAEACDRLQDTGPGRLFLTKIGQEHSKHFVREYVLRSSAKGPADALTANIAQAAGAAVADLWLALATVLVKKHGLETLVAEFDNVSAPVLQKALLSPPELVTVTHTVRRGTGAVPVTLEFKVTRPTDAAPAWTGSKEQATRFKQGLVFVNFLLAIEAALKSDPNAPVNPDIDGDKLKSLLSFVAVFLEAQTAFREATKSITEKGTRNFGRVVAILQLVAAGIEADKAIGVNDYDQAGAHGLAMVGSALMFAGAVVAAGGAPTVILPAVGAVLTVVGAVLAAMAQDGPLETFAKHCEWGAYRGQSTQKPRWTAAALSQWPGNHAVQLRALANLVHAFRLERIDATTWNKVRIHFAHVPPEACLEVFFEVEAPEPSGKLRCGHRLVVGEILKSGTTFKQPTALMGGGLKLVLPFSYNVTKSFIELQVAPTDPVAWTQPFTATVEVELLLDLARTKSIPDPRRRVALRYFALLKDSKESVWSWD